MCVVVIFLIIALLVWCRAVVSREGFDDTETSTINEMQNQINKIGDDAKGINENVGYINQQIGKINDTKNSVDDLLNALSPYYNNGEFVLSDGSTGPKGDTGGTGPKGDKGIQGTRGQDGINGASIFDVSRIMLNGDTDIFSKKVDDAEPQPSSAYTTLFG